MIILNQRQSFFFKKTKIVSQKSGAFVSIELKRSYVEPHPTFFNVVLLHIRMLKPLRNLVSKGLYFLAPLKICDPVSAGFLRFECSSDCRINYPQAIRVQKDLARKTLLSGLLQELISKVVFRQVTKRCRRRS